MDDKVIKQIFAETLELDVENINDNLEYNKAPEWDSIAHMALISNIEDEFEIMLSTDDVLNMSSYKVAKDILIKNGVSIR